MVEKGIEIVPAVTADVPSIHRIESESFPVPWRREFFSMELGAPGRLNLVARRNQTVVGYLFAMWVLDEMHVNKIAVTAEERRRGIADLLMDHCFRAAIEHRIRTISLEVRQSNEGAQAFYRVLGFNPAFVRKRYYPDGENAVVMERLVEGSRGRRPADR